MLGQGESQLDNSNPLLGQLKYTLLPRLIVQTADMLSLCVRMVKDV